MMPRTWQALAALTLALLLCGPARAQRMFEEIHIQPGLLMNKSVQEELKLTDEQVDSARKLAEEIRDRFRDSREKLNQLQGDEREAAAHNMADTFNKETRKGLEGFLKPDQLKRFEQINMQQRGPAALLNPEVRAPLKLTDDQLRELKALSSRTGDRMREVFQDGDTPIQNRMDKVAAIQAEAMEAVGKVLDDSQEATWKDLIGAPFKIRFEQPPGGGGR